ncbi:MAG: hypothetical protein MPN21_15225 [Thermoanaerobaculia bacterium]|nr:hypothetical protein [Thermoanaerobaculia bacterium]
MSSSPECCPDSCAKPVKGFAPVPVLRNELLRELWASGLRVTESWHKALSTIPHHAHRRATVTLLLDGSFRESYPSRRDIECEAPAIHVRPPGAPHTDRLGALGAHNVVLELDDARFDSVRRHSSLFDEVRSVEQHDVVATVRRIQREILIDDASTALARGAGHGAARQRGPCDGSGFVA